MTNLHRKPAQPKAPWGVCAEFRPKWRTARTCLYIAEHRISRVSWSQMQKRSEIETGTSLTYVQKDRLDPNSHDHWLPIGFLVLCGYQFPHAL